MKWTLLIILLSAGSSCQTVDTTKFFGKWNDKLRDIADEITARLSATESRNCECSYYACGERPDKNITECLKSDHKEKLLCGVNHCGHMNVCYSSMCVRMPTVCFVAQHKSNIRSHTTFCDTGQLRQRNQERHLLNSGAYMQRFHFAGPFSGFGRRIQKCQRLHEWVCSVDLLWGSRGRNIRVLCILMQI